MPIVFRDIQGCRVRHLHTRSMRRSSLQARCRRLCISAFSFFVFLMGALSARFIKKHAATFHCLRFRGMMSHRWIFIRPFLAKPKRASSLWSSGLPKTLTSPSFSRQAKASKLSLVFWLTENVDFAFVFSPSQSEQALFGLLAYRKRSLSCIY